MHSTRAGWYRGATLAACLAMTAVAGARADSFHDRVKALAKPMDGFLRREETGGVTLDPRRLANLPEQIRLSVVPQLLAFCELQPVWRWEDHPLDVVQRADFLAAGKDAFRAGDAADGMLGYALLRAYETTGDPRYRDAAQPIVDACLGLELGQLRLNRGLMAALALAQHHRLTGDLVSRAKAMEIVLLALREQHADGSFPHVCEASRDVHYTAWMGMELHLLGRLLDDPRIASALERARAFLQGRVGLDGMTAYEEALGPDWIAYYYSQPTCPDDYDTRGWTNELGYLALLFDGTDEARFGSVLNRIEALMVKGAVPDKWGFLPSPDDPFAAWADAPRSVIRTSLVFWSLARVYADQLRRMPPPDDGTEPGAAGSRRPVAAGRQASDTMVELGPPTPNPARGAASLALRLEKPAQVRVAVLDPAGRRLATLVEGPVSAGIQMLRWNGADRNGRRAPPGVYFVRVEVDGCPARTRRLVLVP